MKKLSLKNAKSTLSRKEMRVITGGYGGFGGGGNCCVITPVRGYLVKDCFLSPADASSRSCQYSGAYWCCGSGC